MKKLFIFLTLLTGAFIVSQSVIAYTGLSGRSKAQNNNKWIPMGNLVSAGNFSIKVSKPGSLPQQPIPLTQSHGTVAAMTKQPGTVANKQQKPVAPVVAKITLNNVNPVGTMFAQNAQDHQSFGMARTASIFDQNYLRALGEHGAYNAGMIPVVFASGDNLMLMNAQKIRYTASKNQMVLTGKVVASTTSLQNFTKNNQGPYALAALNSSTRFLGYNANNQTANFANYNQPDNVGIFTINFDNLDPGMNSKFGMQQASVTFAMPKYH
ncbi:MAG: hypothetical protein PVI75_08455 [Gammaproteobacteria bacterium]|jgi:hypothetical protein